MADHDRALSATRDSRVQHFVSPDGRVSVWKKDGDMAKLTALGFVDGHGKAPLQPGSQCREAKDAQSVAGVKDHRVRRHAIENHGDHQPLVSVVEIAWVVVVTHHHGLSRTGGGRVRIARSKVA